MKPSALRRLHQRSGDLHTFLPHKHESALTKRFDDLIPSFSFSFLVFCLLQLHGRRSNDRAVAGNWYIGFEVVLRQTEFSHDYEQS